MEDSPHMAPQSSATGVRDSNEVSKTIADDEKLPLRIQHIWAHEGDQGCLPTDDIGPDLFTCLRGAGCKIPYWKNSPFLRSYYLGPVEIYRFYFAPSPLRSMVDLKSERFHTYLGSTWVRKRALDHLGYKYKWSRNASVKINGYFTYVSGLSHSKPSFIVYGIRCLRIIPFGCLITLLKPLEHN